MNHVKCLISTIICSAKVLKFIEYVKWIVLVFTVVLSAVHTFKLIKSGKFIER